MADPIRRDDVLNAHEQLRGEGQHLQDFGIGPVTFWALRGRCTGHDKPMDLVMFVSTLGEIPGDNQIQCPNHDEVKRKIPVTHVERLNRWVEE